MADATADTVVILSSELIARITEQYFNKTMFKQPVEIVDLKPTETGYMFSIAFVATQKQQQKPAMSVDTTKWLEGMPEDIKAPVRASNGKFAKKE